VADRDHHDQHVGIVHGVQNPTVALAHTVDVLARRLFAARGSRVGGEGRKAARSSASSAKVSLTASFTIS
jgi:hypothetical protein